MKVQATDPANDPKGFLRRNQGWLKAFSAHCGHGGAVDGSGDARAAHVTKSLRSGWLVAANHITDAERTIMSKVVSFNWLLTGIAVASSLGIGYAIGAQPHMEATVALLQNASGELSAATPNKGGHRERGLALIDEAIEQVREGITFAATH
jgi:hypothetical protein